MDTLPLIEHDFTLIAAALVYREARLLDCGEWQTWVEMYRSDAVYWAPAWRDEYETTSDPEREVSLIYRQPAQS